jgi:hypothetical protein
MVRAIEHFKSFFRHAYISVIRDLLAPKPNLRAENESFRHEECGITQVPRFSTCDAERGSENLYGYSARVHANFSNNFQSTSGCHSPKILKTPPDVPA